MSIAHVDQVPASSNTLTATKYVVNAHRLTLLLLWLGLQAPSQLEDRKLYFDLNHMQLKTSQRMPEASHCKHCP